MPDIDPIETEPDSESQPALDHRLRVGEYEGLRAGEAIVAVRERGLRPSLERVEGYEERLQGFVVSQEPQAGEPVAVDSQVFLYIGAPARAVTTGAEGSPEQAGAVEAEEEAPAVDAEFRDAAESREESVDELEATDEFEAQDGLEQLTATEFAEEDEPLDAIEEFIDEEPEPVRVWRGPAPGARTVRSLELGARAARRVPVGVKVAVIGLFACALVTLLVSVVARSGNGAGGRGRVAIGMQAPKVATSKRGGGARRQSPRFSGQAGLAAARVEHARRAAGQRNARLTGRAGRAVVVRAATSAPASVAADGGPSTAVVRAAQEVQAEREFGP